MRVINCFLILIFFLHFNIEAQNESFTVSGFIQDQKTGERLIGANIYETNLKKGTITNSYGFFSITLPSDSISLTISFIGYQKEIFKIYLNEDINKIFYLEPQSFETQQVVIVGNRGESIEAKTQMSEINIPVSMIQTLPAILGEVDVLKVIQLLPGVKTGNEGTSGIYVRGGGPDQNLILLDEAPVYNVSHLFGFFSVFNSDAIKNVTLIKGGFPARYGGRLSSVLDISLKDGNMKEFHGNFSIGIISSKLTLEGPLAKDKTSFIISGRRTYFDLIARPFMNKDEYGGYYFYDLNIKVNHIFSLKDRLFTSLYLGKDILYSEDNVGTKSSFDLGWGNTTSTMRWNHIFSDKLFGNSAFIYSKYKFEINSTTQDFSGDKFTAKYFSGIRDIGLKEDMDFIPSSGHYIKFGVNATFHTFTPEIVQLNANDNVDTLIAPQPEYNSMEYALYAEDDFEITSALRVNLGIHAAGIDVTNKFYFSAQPRIALRYLFNNGWSLKSSFSTMSQNLHLLSTNNVGLPNDLWVPSTKIVKPQSSYQIAAGVAHSFNNYEVSVEGYYKKMFNLIEYEQGTSFILNNKGWEQSVILGQGYSYGIEFFLQKRIGNLSGWLGYTYSRTMRRFDELNFGKEFPAKFDRRHDIAITAIYKLSSKVDISGSWVFNTGDHLTVPLGFFYLDENLIIKNSYNSYYGLKKIYSDRNAYSMPAYHRLDISLRYQAGNNIWTFSVYNAYNQKNPFYIYFDEDRSLNKVTAKKVSVFPIIPSISYSYKF